MRVKSGQFRCRLNRAARRKAAWEMLESRLMLTAYVVNTASDTIAADGQLSLREAIMAAVSQAAVGDAPAGSASNSITFNNSLIGSPATLTLTSALPDL